MTEEAYRFRVDGEGYQTRLVPANEAALDFCRSVAEGSHVLGVFKNPDPAKDNVHRFLFALLREMHHQWPGESTSFDWFYNSLKRWLIPGACEVRETKRGPVPLYESWSYYSLSKKRQLEIVDAVKNVAKTVLGWDEADIDAAVKR